MSKARDGPVLFQKCPGGGRNRLEAMDIARCYLTFRFSRRGNLELQEHFLTKMCFGNLVEIRSPERLVVGGDGFEEVEHDYLLRKNLPIYLGHGIILYLSAEKNKHFDQEFSKKKKTLYRAFLSIHIL